MRDDESFPTHQVRMPDSVVGFGFSGRIPEVRLDPVDDLLNQLQRQIGARHPHEMPIARDHGMRDADHVDVRPTGIEVRLGDVQPAIRLRAVVPILIRSMIIVMHDRHFRSVPAIHPGHRVPVGPRHVLVGDVDPIDLVVGDLRDHAPQILHHHRVWGVSQHLLTRSRRDWNHADAPDEVIQLRRRIVNRQVGPRVSLPDQLVAAVGIVCPQGGSEDRTAEQGSKSPEPATTLDV